MFVETLILSSIMAAAAGLIGCFAVMRRMALAADALSHVALPGIGVALALHVNPVLGAVTMLFFGALLVWSVEDSSRLATETLVGVVFSAALAIGSMTTSGEDLIEALFGGAAGSSLSRAEVFLGIAAATGVVLFVLSQKDALVVMLVSRDIGRTSGINVRRLNLLYLEMFALTVALGLRFLGVLLMGSLIIIPAATAKRLSRNLNEMLALAAASGAIATVLGTVLGRHFHRDTGPLIVTLSTAGFLISFLRRAQ